MNERDDVIAIVANLELEDYFVIHGIHTVWSNGKRSRVYTAQDKRGGHEADTNTKEKGYRKMVAILVEVRDE